MKRRVDGLKPRPKQTITEWCFDNVNLSQGLTPRLDASITPHMIGPLNWASDHRIKELHWLWSPGGGKTTAIEGLTQWRMANSPSNILVIGQKDDTAERWMETRLLPSIKKNPMLKHLLPSQSGTDRHKIRKTTVIFNHGFYLEAGGNAESNLQEKSMPLVIFDEAWKTSEKPGRIQQGKQRTHDKWNAMVLFAGQAGETHHSVESDDALCDLFREWRKTDQRTFCFECQECHTVQPFKWDQMKWDKVEIPGYGIDWTKTGETVRMTCCNPDCNTEYQDNIKNRRILAESALNNPATIDGYMVMNPNAEKGYVGAHANAMSYWRIPWVKLVQQFEEAMEAKYRGDLTLLQVFVMQRLAEFWTPVAYENNTELTVSDYKTSDFDNGELIDNEECRSLAVDVQQNDLWFTVGAMGAGGVLQILNCGQALTFDEIDKLRAKYKINPKYVLVDSKYRQNYVIQKCAEYGWTAYRGVFRDSYDMVIRGSKTKVLYDGPVPVQSGSGARANAINLCVNPLKDALAEMRAGRMGKLMIPSDIDPQYKKHLNAEVKRKVVAGRDKKEVEMWIRINKRPNHMLDNTMALVGIMVIRQILKVYEINEEAIEIKQDEE